MEPLYSPPDQSVLDVWRAEVEEPALPPNILFDSTAVVRDQTVEAAAAAANGMSSSGPGLGSMDLEQWPNFITFSSCPSHKYSHLSNR
ncbi:hypothetical protein PoB_004948300 [Plakobranchus ocellatus]|uniref:Uncharacterized protein n=1 Tax=Plakobranchus ocellatus TaxID=259542 RepID=A0AAV4BVZ5_9GAST|nr:hypothetical protein PoB_004948300 [Plakobranchus ocellatus]